MGHDGGGQAIGSGDGITGEGINSSPGHTYFHSHLGGGNGAGGGGGRGGGGDFGGNG